MADIKYCMNGILTLKVLLTTAADNILNLFCIFSEKIRLVITCESSAKQMIHMKWQVLFFQKNNKINFGMSSVANLLNPLQVHELIQIEQDSLFYLRNRKTDNILKPGKVPNDLQTVKSKSACALMLSVLHHLLTKSEDTEGCIQ